MSISAPWLADDHDFNGQGTKKAIEILLKRSDFNVNGGIDQHGNTLLHYLAVTACQLPAVEALVSHGADPNIANENGMQPLHIAAVSPSKCSGQFTMLLARQGAEPDVTAAMTTRDGDSLLTPLHLAAGRCGNVNAIEALVAASNMYKVKRRRKKDLDQDFELDQSNGTVVNVSLQDTDMSMLTRTTKLGKTVSALAIENDRFDVLERLDVLAGDKFSIFETNPKPIREQRPVRNLGDSDDGGYVACRYFVKQCDQRINQLSQREKVCQNKVDQGARADMNSYDMLRRAVLHSSSIIKLQNNNVLKKFYFVIGNSANYFDAQMMCKDQGGTLAQIHNEAELELVSQMGLFSLFFPISI